jgi:hypothetical protein
MGHASCLLRVTNVSVVVEKRGIVTASRVTPGNPEPHCLDMRLGSFSSTLNRIRASDRSTIVAVLGW